MKQLLMPQFFDPVYIEQILINAAMIDQKRISFNQYSTLFYSTVHQRYVNHAINELPVGFFCELPQINSTHDLAQAFPTQIFFGLLSTFINTIPNAKSFIDIITRSIHDQEADLLAALVALLTPEVYVIYIPSHTVYVFNDTIWTAIISKQVFLCVVRLIIIIDHDAYIAFQDDSGSTFFSTLFLRNILVIIAKSAQLVWDGKQQLHPNSILSENLSFILLDHSSVLLNYIHTGSLYTNSCLTITLEGQYATAQATMPFIARKNQQMVLSTYQYHKNIHTVSVVECNGVLFDKSQTKYLSCIAIDANSFYAKAKQLNKQILMSQEAQSFAQPALEVSNKEVHCSHGTATGQLDEQQINYLIIRGLTRIQAIKLLLHAFFKHTVVKIINDIFLNQL